MTDTVPGLPEEFLLLMQEQLGEVHPEFVRSLATPSPVSVRTNPGKRNFIYGEQVPWCLNGRYVNDRPVFTLDPDFHAGAYYVQEASSMFLEQALIQLGLTQSPLRVLDVCAAPGGKSTHMISLLQSESLLISNEVIRSRAQIVSENLIKWGFPNSIVTNNDPAHFQQLEGFFDVIVIDAPCSGEGMFRKDPGAIQEWSEAHTLHCSKRQQRILNDAWPALKTNGIAVYCTCTFNTMENEEVLKHFGTQHGIESLHLSIDPSWGVEEVRWNGMYGYRFYPHRLRGEGFFLSVFRKHEVQSESLPKFKRTTGNIPDHITRQVTEWISNPERFTFNMMKDCITMVPASLNDLYSYFVQHYNIISSGTAVASFKANKIVPEHALALSVYFDKAHFPTVEFSLDQAIRFLRKDQVDLSGYKKGFTIASYKGLPLGWLNVLDNRANNLYPKSWRIRMQP